MGTAPACQDGPATSHDSCSPAYGAMASRLGLTITAWQRALAGCSRSSPARWELPAGPSLLGSRAWPHAHPPHAHPPRRAALPWGRTGHHLATPASSVARAGRSPSLFAFRVFVSAAVQSSWAHPAVRGGAAEEGWRTPSPSPQHALAPFLPLFLCKALGVFLPPLLCLLVPLPSAAHLSPGISPAGRR